MTEIVEMPSLKPGIYRHYKGGKYRVHGVGRHSEADEYFVVYSPIELAQGKPVFWIRPYAMFFETVNINNEVIPRFQKIEE